MIVFLIYYINGITIHFNSHSLQLLLPLSSHIYTYARLTEVSLLWLYDCRDSKLTLADPASTNVIILLLISTAAYNISEQNT